MTIFCHEQGDLSIIFTRVAFMIENHKNIASRAKIDIP